MADPRTEEALKELEQLQSELVAWQLRVGKLAAKLRALNRGEPPEPKVGKPKAMRAAKKPSKPTKTGPAPSLYQPPSSGLPNLFPELGILCPRCSSRMHWRWSSAKGQHFAGCSNFPDCRGARSLEEVEAVEKQAFELNAANGFFGTVAQFRELQREWVYKPKSLKAADDPFVNVAVKHHGEEAVAEALNDDEFDIPF